MPWTKKQKKLFQAAAHNPEIAKSHGMTQAKAKEMANEKVPTRKPVKKGKK